MDCPSCGRGPLEEGAKYCPWCRAAVEVPAAFQARLQVRQDVHENAGKVIGVEVGSVRGDLIAGTVHQTYVYVLSGQGRGAGWRRFLSEATPPYKFLCPYSSADQAIFRGRDAAIHELVSRIGTQPVVSVYGPAGVGKTSLLLAGVIPELVQYGAQVVWVPEYDRPVAEAVREALTSAREQIPITLPEETGLAAVVRAAVEGLKGTLILVLDNWQRVLEEGFPAAVRDNLLQELAATLQAIAPVDFRLVLVVDSLERLGRMRDMLPGATESPFGLELLTADEAAQAILEPLAVLGYPDTYAAGLVEKRLLPDLLRLHPDHPDRVSPPHLQLVCHTLYQKASTRRPITIDAVLYDELGGAEGIVHRHLRDTLATFGEQGTLARSILERMAFPGVGASLATEQLAPDGATPEQRQAVLDQLVEKALLDTYFVSDQRRYAFSSPVVKEDVLLHALPEVRRRHEAAADLDRAWSRWLAHGELARRSQLHYLAQANACLQLQPAQILLLLRSTVAMEEAAQPWLDRVRGEGRDILRQSDRPEAESAQGSSTPRQQVERLLGLDSDSTLAPAAASDSGATPSRIAQAAVGCRDPVTRRTAALALTATRDDPREALTPLADAMRRARGAWQRWRRQAELRGTLAEADPRFESEFAELGLWTRTGIGLWRCWRRLHRDRRRILLLSAAGGLGAYFGLGLLRFAIALLVGDPYPGSQFFYYSYAGGLLGGSLCLGLTVADSLLAPAVGRRLPAGVGTRWWRGASVVGLGTLAFGMGHAMLALLSGLDATKYPLVIPMGFLFGLGLSLAVVDRLGEGQPRSRGTWLWRTGLAGAVSLLLQVALVLGKKGGGSINLVWPESWYYSRLAARLGEGWPVRLGLLDAALVGAVFAAGIAAGLNWAGGWLARWRDLSNRAGE